MLIALSSGSDLYNNEPKTMHVYIIGNGISGVTAARFLRKNSDCEITIISSESDHFFSRTALMYIYMGHMGYEQTKPYEDYFWKKNRISLVNTHVHTIDFEKQILETSSKGELSYDKLILALGSASNKFGWPGQELNGVGGLYAIQDVENMESFSNNLNRAVIVGGGLIGIEMAEMFHSRHIPVTFLVRENSYWDMVLPSEESAMVNREIIRNGIDLQLETELVEIVDNGSGTCCAVKTSKGEAIDCGFVGLTAGVHPNVKFLKETALDINRGIKVNKYLETNISNVYAIGDCAEQTEPAAGRKPIEAVWYTGKMMGETVAYNILGSKIAYDPGIWFNSAKFIDIEYQVYGEVSGRPPEHHESIYWEHEDGDKAIRLVYDKNTEKIVGLNLMGVRFRHEVCEKWLSEETDLHMVVQQLNLADFDPEFYKSYIGDVQVLYTASTGKKIEKPVKKSLNRVLAFLGK